LKKRAAIAMKYILFVKFLFIELLSEVDEALAAHARFKEVEQVTGTGWND
jgi:hypothetical protein